MQNTLQKKAEEIINKLDLLPLLNLFGEAHLVGNAALKTTVKKDIDYQIYINQSQYGEVADKIKIILEGKNLTQVVIRDLKQNNKYLITGIYLYNCDLWTIDVSLTEPQEDYVNDAYHFFKNFNLKISENLDTIITLKNYFNKKGMLWNGMSYHIYRAVIECNARKVSDIYNYLNENKINISRFKKKIDFKGKNKDNN